MMEINENIAEIVGIILGDGHLHTKNNMITIVGILEDKHYYKERVMPLFLKEFGKEPSLRKRNDRNAYYLLFNSKKVVNFLTKEVGIKRGSKINASVPESIIATKQLARAFLRGLFDTDGCLKFSKQSRNKNYYPRVQIALRHSPMASQLSSIFEKLDFSYGSWDESRFSGIKFYQISGKRNTCRWFNEISPKNRVHSSKFRFWQEFGHYVPKSSLEYREKQLQIQNQNL